MAHLLLDSFKPMLLDDKQSEAFDDPAWLFELKIDGYRMLSEIAAGQVALRTRNGADCTLTGIEVTPATTTAPLGATKI